MKDCKRIQKMAYTDNLYNYKSQQPTQSCYLDGRYFNKVFAKYPGLVREPLNIVIVRDKRTGEVRYHDHMNQTAINNNFPGLMRVIINTPEGRHSSLVIVDYKDARIYRFDPYGRFSPYFEQVNTIIERYLDLYIDFDMYVIDNPVYEQKNPTCVAKGVPSGFCVAYVIKYAYDYLNGRQFDPSGIMQFAGTVEKMYGPLPEEGKDVEYGLFGNPNPDQGRNVAVGALGGALVGGLLTGSPGGVLAGGLGGGLIGGII